MEAEAQSQELIISGESDSVSRDSWKERIPEIAKGYSADDVWNLDESGVFWKALLDKEFGEIVKQVKTTIHTVNGAGKCETKPKSVHCLLSTLVSTDDW